MIPEGPLPFAAAQAARQQAILAAEFAAGLLEPPEDWQLADPDDADFAAWDAIQLAAGPAPRQPGPALAGPDPDSTAGPEPAELLPCGIVAHDAAGPGGAGFASGSVLDTLEPGPVLTGALAEVAAAGLAGLPDDELAGVILAARRCESRALADLLAAVAELHRRRMAHPDRRVGEHADRELAILLTLTSRAAGGMMGEAAALGRMPATMAALRAGRIDRSKAAVVAFETGLIEDDAVAGAVELLVIEDAPGQDPARLRRRLRAAVLAADPGALRRRKELAAADARVELQPELSGNAQLSGRELPPVAAIAADARIDAAARALKAAGAGARLTQLRAAVFLGLLTGSDPLQFLPPDPADTDSAGPAAPGAAAGPEAGLGAPEGSAVPGAGTGPGPATPAPAPAGPPGDPVQPGDSAQSGDLAQSGDPAPPGDLAQSDGPAQRDRPGRQDGGLPVSGSVHLTVPLTTWLGLTGTPGEVPGYGAADADTSRDLADRIAAAVRSRWCLTITDPVGRAIAHACARRPPPSGDPDNRARWLRKLKITRIETGTCGHAREVPGYRIPGSLHHIVQVRQQTCSAPCCSRPAVRCDTDHTLPYDDGGRTCECDLAPLCRTDHQAKQTQGWHLEQPEPGVLVWRLPHGRTYVVRPGIYPA